jgi:hypothetical protein
MLCVDATLRARMVELYSWGATVAGSGGWKRYAPYLRYVPISWHYGNCRTTKNADESDNFRSVYSSVYSNYIEIRLESDKFNEYSAYI